jgi:hypothetical protein
MLADAMWKLGWATLTANRETIREYETDQKIFHRKAI